VSDEMPDSENSIGKPDSNGHKPVSGDFEHGTPETFGGRERFTI